MLRVTGMGHSLDTHVALITPKSLARNGNRSSKVVTLHKLTYAARTSMRLQAMERGLMERFRVLKEPVQKIVGKGDNQTVVHVNDDLALCTVARTIAQIAEQRRVVLRIPSPGRDTAQEAKTIDLPSPAILDAVESEAEPAQQQPMPPDTASGNPS